MKHSFLNTASALLSVLALSTAARAADTTAPQVVIDSPRNGKSYTTSQSSGAVVGGRVADEADGSDIPSGGVKVRLFRSNSDGTSGGAYFNGTSFSSSSPVSLSTTISGTDQIKDWRFTLPTTSQGLTAGTYAMQAVTRDVVGNTRASSVVRFTLISDADSTPPQVLVDVPTQSGSYSVAGASGGTAKGRAADNRRVASVKVTLFRPASGANPGRFFDGTGFNGFSAVELPTTLSGSGSTKTWTLRLPTTAQGFTVGTYTLRAIARDDAGNSANSSVITFMLK